MRTPKTKNLVSKCHSLPPKGNRAPWRNGGSRARSGKVQNKLGLSSASGKEVQKGWWKYVKRIKKDNLKEFSMAKCGTL